MVQTPPQQVFGCLGIDVFFFKNLLVAIFIATSSEVTLKICGLVRIWESDPQKIQVKDLYQIAQIGSMGLVYLHTFTTIINHSWIRKYM